MPLPRFIVGDEALQKLAQDLSGEPLLALDTESNSLHAYRSQVCLVQLSTRQQDYIIDPLSIADMQPLGDLLADDSIEKIFHAAEYDVTCLKRDFDFDICNLFDTMYAARLCGIEHIGLADMLYDFFQVESDKRHQLDDWASRPLTVDMVRYAQMDTHYLPRLRDMLYATLEDYGALEEAREVFADVVRVDVPDRSFDPEGYWKIGKPRSLNKREMAVLRELYLLREELAQEEDVPSFKILHNNSLVELAQRRPTNYRELHEMKRMSARQIRLYGDDVLEAIDLGDDRKLPPPPRPERADRRVVRRYNRLYTWRKECALYRGVDANLVMPKQTLWDLANHVPTTRDDLAKIQGIGDWRLATYGDDLLSLLRKFS